MKKFKVSYSYPLEHPIKVVVHKLGLRGILGWLMQKYGAGVGKKDLVISERIIELPLVQEWIGRHFQSSTGNILEIGHVASSTALELASLGFNVTAIDLRAYPFTHKKLISIKGDLLKYDFSKKFDCVYSLSTIEHFGFSKRYGGSDEPDNRFDEEAFKKISRLLDDNGVAIVSFPYSATHVSGIWFRVYTRADLEKKIGTFFTIKESRYYRRDDNEWTRVKDSADDPSSPHDGVAVFLLGVK